MAPGTRPEGRPGPAADGGLGRVDRLRAARRRRPAAQGGPARAALPGRLDRAGLRVRPTLHAQPAGLRHRRPAGPRRPQGALRRDLLQRGVQGPVPAHRPGQQGPGPGRRCPIPPGKARARRSPAGTSCAAKGWASRCRPPLPLLDFLSMATAPGMFPHQLLYSYVSPRPDALTAAQKAYIDGHIAAFETAMKAPDFANPTTGYRSWIDVASWSDFFILAEVSHNIDAYWKNIVLSKPRDIGGVRGKLSMTPFWDFSIAFGRPEVRTGWRSDKLSFDAANSAITQRATSPGGECAALEWLPRGAPLCGPNCCRPRRCASCPPSAGTCPSGRSGGNRSRPTRPSATRPAAATGTCARPAARWTWRASTACINDWKAQLAAGAYARHLEREPHPARFQLPLRSLPDGPRTAPDPMATPAGLLRQGGEVVPRLGRRPPRVAGRQPARRLRRGQRDAPRRRRRRGRRRASASEPVELARGLVGYWKLDETAGPMAADASPLMNNGTLMGFLPDRLRGGETGNGLSLHPTDRAGRRRGERPLAQPHDRAEHRRLDQGRRLDRQPTLVQKGDNDNQYRLTAEAGVLKLHLAGVTNGTLEAVLPAHRGVPPRGGHLRRQVDAHLRRRGGGGRGERAPSAPSRVTRAMCTSASSGSARPTSTPSPACSTRWCSTTAASTRPRCAGSRPAPDAL